jgi:hypothetical protein
MAVSKRSSPSLLVVEPEDDVPQNGRPTARPPMSSEEFAASLMAALPEGDDAEQSAMREAEPGTERASAPLESGSESEEFDLLDGATEPDPDQYLTDLVAMDPEGSARRMRDAFDAGDFDGALMTAEELISYDPGDTQAVRYALACRSILEQMYLGVLGEPRAIPVTCASAAVLDELGRDPRKGFLLTLMDGVSTVGEIVDLCGSRRLDALRMLVDLVESGVVQIGF